MSGWAIVAVVLAGFAAGTMNAIVGSGSLLTFPVLLALGFSPVVANVSNTVGLSFGNVSGVIGYRRELAGQRARMIGLTLPALAGAVVGALLLLTLPQGVFRVVVAPLILLALVLVVIQPWLKQHIRQRADAGGMGVVLRAGVFLTAVYGGYFGAAQGVILISLFSVMLNDTLQRLNGLKNVVAMLVNGVAAIIFVAVAHVAWEPAALVAVSSVVGGQTGASVGRRLSPVVLRGLLVVAGVAAVVKLLL
ncbi:MAG: sulfite exporter TauE/SafE family protein [Candidatus Dormibacteraeota bacterium]|nr:sulfite exporter TauE/SafE family protein [Candidatus Dormibacteraeota bacterium]